MGHNYTRTDLGLQAVAGVDPDAFVVTEHRVDISTERVDFTAPANTELLYARNKPLVNGVIQVCHEVDPGHIKREGEKPKLYLICGEGFIPAPYYVMVQTVQMFDGLEWYIYLCDKKE